MGAKSPGSRKSKSPGGHNSKDVKRISAVEKPSTFDLFEEKKKEDSDSHSNNSNIS